MRRGISVIQMKNLPRKPNKRKHRPTLSIDKLAEYEDLRQQVVACRKNKEVSASWDEAIMHEVNRRRNEEAIKRKEATSALGQPTPTVVPSKKQKVIIAYEDNVEVIHTAEV